jgi:spoIIIJ-associated protein
MAGFLSKIFGKKKQGGGEIESLLQETLDSLIEKASFSLDYDLSFEGGEDNENQILVEFSGEDEDLLRDKEGQMIDAIQLYLKRVIQHRFPEDRSNVSVDSGGYLQEANQALEDLAEKLKGVALEKGKSVYIRPLAPRDRKVVHQYLASDDRVRSRSVGEGLFKKIKIYPAKGTQPVEKADH